MSDAARSDAVTLPATTRGAGAGPSRRTVLAGLAGAPLALGRRAQAAARFGFVALGDWGRYGSGPQREVAGAMADAAGDIGSRFVVAAGDNFYPAGVSSLRDPHWKLSFEDVYTARTLQTPWYAALGNHDYRGVPHAQVAYSAASPRWRMPSRHYTVAGSRLGVPGLELFVIDTAMLVEGLHERIAQAAHGRFRFRRLHRERQLAWLEGELARSQAAWKIVVGHHPVYSGAHGDDAYLIARLQPLLERHGVQVYVNGHDHNLQHIRRGPVNYVCCGAGAEANDVVPIKGTQFCAQSLGFATFVVEGAELEVGLRDAAGRVLHQARVGRLVS